MTGPGELYVTLGMWTKEWEQDFAPAVQQSNHYSTLAVCIVKDQQVHKY